MADPRDQITAKYGNLTKPFRQKRQCFHPAFIDELACWLVMKANQLRHTQQEFHARHRESLDRWAVHTLEVLDIRIEHCLGLIDDLRAPWNRYDWADAQNVIDKAGEEPVPMAEIKGRGEGIYRGPG